MEKPAKTKRVMVMDDPFTNLKSSAEHMAVAKGTLRSQTSQLRTR
jgi:hypothetical protein